MTIDAPAASTLTATAALEILADQEQQAPAFSGTSAFTHHFVTHDGKKKILTVGVAGDATLITI